MFVVLHRNDWLEAGATKALGCWMDSQSSHGVGEGSLGLTSYVSHEEGLLTMRGKISVNSEMLMVDS